MGGTYRRAVAPHAGYGARVRAGAARHRARAPWPLLPRECAPRHAAEREFFIDNLLVRIHLILEIILVDRPCAMGV